MQIPQEDIKSLEARKIKISDKSVIKHGSALLTVEYQGMTFNKDFSVATPVFIVTDVERPDPKPRKPRASQPPKK